MESPMKIAPCKVSCNRSPGCQRRRFCRVWACTLHSHPGCYSETAHTAFPLLTCLRRRNETFVPSPGLRCIAGCTLSHTSNATLRIAGQRWALRRLTLLLHDRRRVRAVCGRGSQALSAGIDSELPSPALAVEWKLSMGGYQSGLVPQTTSSFWPSPCQPSFRYQPCHPAWTVYPRV